MYSTNVQDLVIEVRDVLDENIDDPISRRAADGKNWVYDDFPNLNATMPRIGIAAVDVTYSSLALGTPKRVKNALIQVSVFVDQSDNKFDVDGDGSNETEEQVLQYLATRVEDEIVANQSFFRHDVGVRYILPTSSTRTVNQDENVLQKNITLEVEFV